MNLCKGDMLDGWFGASLVRCTVQAAIHENGFAMKCFVGDTFEFAGMCAKKFKKCSESLIEVIATARESLSKVQASGYLPRVVVLLHATADAAGSNASLIQHLERHCNELASRTAGPSEPLIMFTHVFCLAHQVQLCFRTLYGRLGPAFMNGLTGSCHIFCSGVHFARIMFSISRLAAELRFVPRAEALRRGIERNSGRCLRRPADETINR
jgi:hypothetical protein